MKFNYSKLLGRMREYGFTQERLAKSLGINDGTLSAKLNSKTSFTAVEIDKICELLEIPNEEIGVYFFSR